MIETLAGQAFLVHNRLSVVFIIKVVEASIFLFENISKDVELLDIDLVHVLENRVRYDHIGERITVLDEINLIQGKVMVYDKDVVDLGLLLRIVRRSHFGVLPNKIKLESATYRQIDLTGNAA